MKFFRITVFVFTLISLPAAATGTAVRDAFPPVQIIDHVEYYAITGNTSGQIDKQLVAHAGQGENSGHGTTRSRFKIRKTLQEHPARCEIAALSVRVSITTKLPNWQPRHSVSASLKSRWEQSSDLLKRHEEGHRDHAIEVSQRLRTTLLSIAPKRSCFALDASIGLELQASMQRLNERDTRYDNRTGNGLRDDPLLDRPAAPNTNTRSSQRRYQADRSPLDILTH